jgi:hypothetical protein
MPAGKEKKDLMGKVSLITLSTIMTISIILIYNYLNYIQHSIIVESQIIPDIEVHRLPNEEFQFSLSMWILITLEQKYLKEDDSEITQYYFNVTEFY